MNIILGCSVDFQAVEFAFKILPAQPVGIFQLLCDVVDLLILLRLFGLLFLRRILCVIHDIGEHGDHDAGENRNDGDHDDELYQRKAPLLFFHGFSSYV